MHNKIIMVIGMAISAAGGLVAGLLIRQPEINRLHKQIESLQENNEKLKNALKDEKEKITELFVKYKALGFFRFIKKREVKDNIQLHLVFQYATSDYLNILIDFASSGAKMSDEEVKFYHSYEKIIDDGIIEAKELESIKDYILLKHYDDIRKLKECNTDPAFERINNYKK